MEYGCIGEKLGHSFSREIHRALFDYDYRLQEVTPANLPSFLQKKDFKGINVTIPYKEAVLPFLDRVDESARAIGAVNTIVRQGDDLIGFNTDFYGMASLLKRAGIDLAGKKVLIAGSGGTSKTAEAVAAHLGAKEIFRVSRTGAGGLITYEEARKAHRDAAVWINATPCGMFPRAGETPFSVADYPALTGVADAVYNPLRSRLVLLARERGVPAAGGLFMLVAQAVRAGEIFTGATVQPEKTEAVYRRIFKEKENLILVGMPGCGKTTLGRMAAARLGMDFYDGDLVLEEKTGMHPADMIREKGEAAFRDAEEAVLRELSAKNHAVIATGGGAVLRRENVLNLKSNGRILFLDRPLADLAVTSDRPLSDRREKLALLYRERIDLYRAASDGIIPCEKDAEKNAKKITEAFIE